MNDGTVNVVTGSLEGGFARQELPDTAANTVNLAVGRVGLGSEFACIAYHPTDDLALEGEVRVACATEYGHGQWHPLGGVAIEAADVVDRLPVEIAITTDPRMYRSGTEFFYARRSQRMDCTEWRGWRQLDL